MNTTVIKVPRSDGKAKSVVLQGGEFKVCFYLDRDGKIKEAWKSRTDGKPILCEDDLWIHHTLYTALKRRAYAILFPREKS